ncbi:MAG: hypothetical protein PHP51_02035 [Desulfotomaculaceae bacterium]|nr:hypothetical protein [Desulfotomaculaceae bacterium]MDD4767942.1 hypothetical protein [Desulfotomaculaceae bacterium]
MEIIFVTGGTLVDPDRVTPDDICLTGAVLAKHGSGVTGSSVYAGLPGLCTFRTAVLFLRLPEWICCA